MEFSSFARRVGANVRRARWAAGMTQEAVGAEALTLRILSELERGHGNPTLTTLFSLARVLRVPVKDLVDVGDGPRGATPLAERKAVPPKPGRKPRPRRLATR
ncbi:MAG: helix-turn-helix domain-containing protein [Polyangiaceae bacterium]